MCVCVYIYIYIYIYIHIYACYAQSCLILCDPIDLSPPSSSIHWISQARILVWVAISTPGDLPDPGTEPASPEATELEGRFFITEPPRKPQYIYHTMYNQFYSSINYIINNCVTIQFYLCVLYLKLYITVHCIYYHMRYINIYTEICYILLFQPNCLILTWQSVLQPFHYISFPFFHHSTNTWGTEEAKYHKVLGKEKGTENMISVPKLPRAGLRQSRRNQLQDVISCSDVPRFVKK